MPSSILTPVKLTTQMFANVTTKASLFGDARRQKELFICTKIRPDLTVDVTYEVWDAQAEPGLELVTVTWELPIALAAYNAL